VHDVVVALNSLLYKVHLKKEESFIQVQAGLAYFSTFMLQSGKVVDWWLMHFIITSLL